MPVYRKDRERWRVRIWHKGTRRDWIVPGSRNDALAFEARKRTELDAADPVDLRTAPKFSSFCLDRYSAHCRAELGKQTWANRRYQIATLIAHFGKLRLDKVTEVDVEAFVAARRAAKIGAVTINDELKVLRHLYGWAVEKRAVARMPKIKKLQQPKRNPRKAQAWTADEVAALYEACESKSPHLLPVLVFLVNTGCRKTEAITLRWSSVDWTAGVLWIEPNEEWRPKDGEARQVPLGRVLREWLDRLRTTNDARATPGANVFTGSGRGKNKGAALPWARWPQLQFDRARTAAALEGGPHKLRHTFASHFLANGGDMFRLSQILGHSNERTTELYSHMVPGRMQAVADLVSFAPVIGPAAAEAKREWKRGG